MKIILNPQIIIFIGVIIGATGVIISGIGAYLASHQQSKFEHELRVKSEEITDLNKEIVNLVTGGNSFAFIYPVVEPTTNDLVFDLVQQGDYPTFDAEVMIESTSKDISEEVNKIEELKQLGTPEAQTEISRLYRKLESFTLKLAKVGTLPVNTLREVYRIPTTKAERNYKIKIFTRTGIIEQLIRRNDKENKWEIFEVKKHENDGSTSALNNKIDPYYIDNKGKNL